jgi:Domain of unknown function (DUF1906)
MSSPVWQVHSPYVANFIGRFLVLTVLLSGFVSGAKAQSYLGFDRNQYPADENLKALRQTFTFSGYWLNNPPGETTNTWVGKRTAVQSAGLGFLILFNGRLFAELKDVSHASTFGKTDGQAAIAAARNESFPPGTVIFLDQEQGGRMLPQQKAYIYNWVDVINASGYQAGIYCSGIAAQESPGVSIVTADDIRQKAEGRKIVYFVTNDACPPSPGCAFPAKPPSPTKSAIAFADIWQFAQSPKRRDFAGGCHNYAAGNCYPPGFPSSTKIHVDVDTATSADPSHGRSQ